MRFKMQYVNGYKWISFSCVWLQVPVFCKLSLQRQLTISVYFYFICWQDNKSLHMLSWIPANKATCSWVVRTGRRWVPNTTCIIPRPSIFQVYNYGIGGTDAFDQLISYYRSLERHSWYPRGFIHVIIACCINAYILYNLYWKLSSKTFAYSDLSVIWFKS